MARYNKTITVVAGTPFNAVTGMTTAQMIANGYTSIPETPLNEIIIQMVHGGTGLGFVMTGIRGQTSPTQQWRTPSASASTDLTAELAPATATAPGGSYSDPLNNSGIIWGDQVWIDGSHSGDTVIISYDTKS